MKTIKSILLAATLLTGGLIGITSCTDYQDEIDSLDRRVYRLEHLVDSINQNLDALQMFINAAADGWIIKGMAELEDHNGYVINFYKIDPKTGKIGEEKTITVHNGKDAEAPNISLKQDPTDGNYYWFITYPDGLWDWLTGEDGERIRVNGQNGKPGTDYSPKLSVVGGYWYISYYGENPHPLLDDHGKMIPAIAQDGEKGDPGDSANPIIKGVTLQYTSPTEGFFIFELEGNTIRIPFTIPS